MLSFKAKNLAITKLKTFTAAAFDLGYSLSKKSASTSSTTLPFTYNSESLSDTNSAQQNLEILTFEVCGATDFTLDACGGSEGDTYMRLYYWRSDTSDSVSETSNDDSCGRYSRIYHRQYQDSFYHRQYQDSCFTYELHLGCFNFQTCSYFINGYIGSGRPTPSPTDPTQSPTLYPSFSPTQPDIEMQLPFTLHISELDKQNTINFTASEGMLFTVQIRAYDNVCISCSLSCVSDYYGTLTVSSSWLCGHENTITLSNVYNNDPSCNVYEVQLSPPSSTGSFGDFIVMASIGTSSPTVSPTPFHAEMNLPFEHTTAQISNNPYPYYAKVSAYYGDDGVQGEICNMVDIDGILGVSFCSDGIAAFTYDDVQRDVLYDSPTFQGLYNRLNVMCSRTFSYYLIITSIVTLLLLLLLLLHYYYYVTL